MLIQRISRSDPERVFVVVRAAAAGVAKGESCSFNMSGTRNGIDVIPGDDATDIALAVGSPHTDIASGDYGLVQVYGYDDDVICYITGDSFKVGNPLVWSSAKSGWAEGSASAPDGASLKCVVACASAHASSATSGTIALPCFVRFM